MDGIVKERERKDEKKHSNGPRRRRTSKKGPPLDLTCSCSNWSTVPPLAGADMDAKERFSVGAAQKVEKENETKRREEARKRRERESECCFFFRFHFFFHFSFVRFVTPSSTTGRKAPHATGKEPRAPRTALLLLPL